MSSGPGVLQELHESVGTLLRSKSPGESLSARDIVDLMNLIGKCIVAGNIRRSAQIALGKVNDDGFLALKDYERNPERIPYGWASNNSVLAEIGMDYSEVAEGILRNGEPGLAWLENMRAYSRMGREPDYRDKLAAGGNPCLE